MDGFRVAQVDHVELFVPDRDVAAAWYARTLTHVAPAKLLPFNRDQVVMSQENNTADLAKFEEFFGWEPRGFEETLKEYATQL